MIKVNGRPSEQYWLSLMRTWLSSIQRRLDEAIKKGSINGVTGEMKSDVKIVEEAKIARRLVCSYGNNYNCTGRVSYFLCSSLFYNFLTKIFYFTNKLNIM